MEQVKIYRKAPSGMEYAFYQTIQRGKHGRFVRNPFAEKNFPSLVIALQSICLVVLLYFIVFR